MTDAGFFRGTSAEQDNRFTDKQKKLLKQLRFHDVLTKRVDMTKVNLNTIKPWITKRITQFLGMEDEVVVEFVFNQLEADKHPDPRMMQINLTGFLNGKNARDFMGDLWTLLLSAQETVGGIPAEILEEKKAEIRRRQEEQERMQDSMKRAEEREREKMVERAREAAAASFRERTPEKPKERSNHTEPKPKPVEEKPHRVFVEKEPEPAPKKEPAETKGKEKVASPPMAEARKETVEKHRAESPPRRQRSPPAKERRHRSRSPQRRSRSPRRRRSPHHAPRDRKSVV